MSGIESHNATGQDIGALHEALLESLHPDAKSAAGFISVMLMDISDRLTDTDMQELQSVAPSQDETFDWVKFSNTVRSIEQKHRNTEPVTATQTTTAETGGDDDAGAGEQLMDTATATGGLEAPAGEQGEDFGNPEDYVFQDSAQPTLVTNELPGAKKKRPKKPQPEPVLTPQSINVPGSHVEAPKPALENLPKQLIPLFDDTNPKVPPSAVAAEIPSEHVPSPLVPVTHEPPPDSTQLLDTDVVSNREQSAQQEVAMSEQEVRIKELVEKAQQVYTDAIIARKDLRHRSSRGFWDFLRIPTRDELEEVVRVEGAETTAKLDLIQAHLNYSKARSTELTPTQDAVRIGLEIAEQSRRVTEEFERSHSVQLAAQRGPSWFERNKRVKKVADWVGRRAKGFVQDMKDIAATKEFHQVLRAMSPLLLLGKAIAAKSISPVVAGAVVAGGTLAGLEFVENQVYKHQNRRLAQKAEHAINNNEIAQLQQAIDQIASQQELQQKKRKISRWLKTAIVITAVQYAASIDLGVLGDSGEVAKTVTPETPAIRQPEASHKPWWNFWEPSDGGTGAQAPDQQGTPAQTNTPQTPIAPTDTVTQAPSTTPDSLQNTPPPVPHETVVPTEHFVDVLKGSGDGFTQAFNNLLQHTKSSELPEWMRDWMRSQKFLPTGDHYVLSPEQSADLAHQVGALQESADGVGDMSIVLNPSDQMGFDESGNWVLRRNGRTFVIKDAEGILNQTWADTLQFKDYSGE